MFLGDPYKLKPCPFCKSENLDSLVTTDLCGFKTIGIHCQDCCCIGPQVPIIRDPTSPTNVGMKKETFEAEKKAKRLWNDRA